MVLRGRGAVEFDDGTIVDLDSALRVTVDHLSDKNPSISADGRSLFWVRTWNHAKETPSTASWILRTSVDSPMSPEKLAWGPHIGRVFASRSGWMAVRASVGDQGPHYLHLQNPAGQIVRTWRRESRPLGQVVFQAQR